MVTVNLKNYSGGVSEVNVKRELADFLQMAGVYPGGGDQLCSGMDLAVRIEHNNDDEIELSDGEHVLLKSVLNILLTKTTPPLGGPRYNELIIRVFKAGK